MEGTSPSPCAICVFAAGIRESPVVQVVVEVVMAIVAVDFLILHLLLLLIPDGRAMPVQYLPHWTSSSWIPVAQLTAAEVKSLSGPNVAEVLHVLRLIF